MTLRLTTYVAIDTETTGLRPGEGDEIVSIGAARVIDGQILAGETFYRLVNPMRRIPKSASRIHGITDAMVEDEPTLAVLLPEFKAFIGEEVVIGHNLAFDLNFFHAKAAACGVKIDNRGIDTMIVSQFLDPVGVGHSLDALIARHGIAAPARHSALGDATAAAEIFLRQIGALEARGIASLDELLRATGMARKIRANMTRLRNRG
jgi:DNA polymerase III subunit epsilon